MPILFSFLIFINRKEVKGDTKKRLVVNIYSLNIIIIVDVYPMPL